MGTGAFAFGASITMIDTARVVFFYSRTAGEADGKSPEVTIFFCLKASRPRRQDKYYYICYK